ncbi:MAG TPA: hypothetical protein VFB82_16560, partial [Blastocatellia bacterium]|nr:hypothetical protein [Blastocatellia bacterium]
MAIWFTLFGAMPFATRGRWDLAGCPREALPPVITPGIPRLPGDWLNRTGLMAWQPSARAAGRGAYSQTTGDRPVRLHSLDETLPRQLPDSVGHFQ